MVKISQSVKEEMIKRGVLVVEKGRYTGLVVSNRKHKGKAKSYFIREDLYRKYKKSKG